MTRKHKTTHLAGNLGISCGLSASFLILLLLWCATLPGMNCWALGYSVFALWRISFILILGLSYNVLLVSNICCSVLIRAEFDQLKISCALYKYHESRIKSRSVYIFFITTCVWGTHFARSIGGILCWDLLLKLAVFIEEHVLSNAKSLASTVYQR